MTGCSTYVSNIEGQAFAPIDPPVKLSSPRPANGSIFHSSQNGLFATDQRARRVGDILTVSFNETYSATKAQTASSSKADNFGVTLPTGLPNIFTGGFDKDAGGNGAGLSAGTTRSFAGAGNAVYSSEEKISDTGKLNAFSFDSTSLQMKYINSGNFVSAVLLRYFICYLLLS